MVPSNLLVNNKSNNSKTSDSKILCTNYSL